MIQDFDFRSPTRLVFGQGCAARAGAELAAMGLRRVLVVTGRGPTASSPGLARLLGSLRAAGIEAVLHSRVGPDPDSGMVAEAAAALAEARAEGLLAYGGGSPIDCAKAASLLAANSLLSGAPEPGADPLDFVYGRRSYKVPGLPLVAVPTTAGTGSEMSAAAVTTDLAAGRKLGLSSDWYFPRLALVDPELQLGMPPALTAATGMDALTHVIESFVSRRANPVSKALAAESGRLLLGSLGRAYRSGAELEARADCALGSSLVGVAFSQSGLGMVHGFAHPVGARCGLAHGLANAVILPWVMEAAAETEPRPFAELARALGLASPPAESAGGAAATAREAADRAAAAGLCLALRELRAELGIPDRLSEAGVPRAEFAAVLADAKSYRSRGASPRLFSDAELEALLDRAF